MSFCEAVKARKLARRKSAEENSSNNGYLLNDLSIDVKERCVYEAQPDSDAKTDVLHFPLPKMFKLMH